MTERFAIYYAPSTADPLWNRAAQWLGRDAANPVLAESGEIGGISAARRREMTLSASRYGFHATLKAPMALRPGTTEAQFHSALEHFADSSRPVEIGRLKLASLAGFLALVPEQQSDELADLAMSCVTAFETVRAPADDDAQARRRKHGLTERQSELLEAYGYPYVAEEFRFHMTLTDRLADVDRDAVMAAAEGWFGPALERPFMLDRIALFHEPAPGGLFRRGADYLLGAKVAIDA